MEKEIQIKCFKQPYVILWRISDYIILQIINTNVNITIVQNRLDYLHKKYEYFQTPLHSVGNTYFGDCVQFS